MGPGAGAGPGSGPGPGSGGDGGSGPTQVCGNGAVEGTEDCDTDAPWCQGCEFACSAPNEAWNPGNAHCYRFVKDDDKSFQDANSDCGVWRPNAHLVSITSAEEQQWVAQRISEQISPFENTYLGGRKMSGAWQWVSGEPWGYTNFHAGEGNNNSEPCLGVYTATGPGPWHDFTCNPVEAYVCEWDPTP